MSVLVLRELSKTEDAHHVDVCIINHEADVADVAGDLNIFFLDFPPENHIDEDPQYFFESVKVDNFGSLSLEAI